MLKLNALQLALTAMLALILVLVIGVLSTRASNGYDAPRSSNIPNVVQTVPPPVGTYPRPVPSYPAPVPSYYPPLTATAKPTREPEPTLTPHPWLRYVEVLPTVQQ